MSASSSRLTMSEPRLRAAMNRNRERADSENAVSRTRRRCNGGGDRPNNWQEISDWPIAGNQSDNYHVLVVNNAEQDKRSKQDRSELNVGWSTCRDESSNPAIRTPLTFPRATARKVPRANVDNIRQQLMLSDADDTSTDGERSNELNIQSAGENRMRNNSGSMASSLTAGSAAGGKSRRNTNLNNDSDKPDSNQIIGRLMQIRDYIKQTTAMMQQMKEPPNLCSEDSYYKLNSLLDSLRKQEKGYLNLLQKVLEAKEEDILIRQNSSDSRQMLGSDVSIELETRSSASTDTQTDLVAVNDELQSLRQQHELLKEMLSQQEQLRALHSRQAALTALKKQAEQGLNEQRSKNMDVLSAEFQTNADANQNELNSENTSMENEEITMVEVPIDHQEETSSSKTAGVGQSSVTMYKFPRLENLCPTEEQQAESLHDDERENSDSEGNQIANSYEQRQLRDKLTSLQQKKQEMDQLLQELQRMRDEQLMTQTVNNAISPKLGQTLVVSRRDESRATGMEDETENIEQVMEVRRKLKKLEEVKARLGQLKQLVQYYKTSNEFIHGPQQEEGGDGTGSYAREAYTTDTTGEVVDDSSEPPSGEYEHMNFLANLTQSNVTNSRKLPKPSASMPAVDLEYTMPSSGQASGDQLANDAMSDESSDFGGWGNDPDVKDKVRRLKAAKEKLHHLQALVSVAQNSPEGLQFLPEDLAQLAASFGNPQLEHDESADTQEASVTRALTSVPLGSKTSTSTTSCAKQDESEKYYQSRMTEQRLELEQLMEEKRKLLALQQNLQRLHDELPTQKQNDGSAMASRQVTTSVRHQEHAEVQTEDEPSEMNNTEVKSVSETTQVTFGEPLETVISNEEVYGRMRQQRILREELREKKKELENFMKKDRPKRHYFRNQDNQSDNISYSNKSDQYGGASASEDVTMATWGGSTAGNMESIEENDSGEGQGMDDCNDGYPNDGIIQVEEEEEANDQSEDRITYTIEDDFDSKRMPAPPVIGASCGRNEGRKGGKGAPFMGPGGAAGYSYSQWASNENRILNNARRPAFEQSKLGRAKKAGVWKDKAVEEELRLLKEQVQYLTSVIHSRLEVASPHLHPLQVGPGLTSPGLYPPYPGPYPSQAYERQLAAAVEEMRERLSALERSGMYSEPWPHRSWYHQPGSGSIPMPSHGMPVTQRYDASPMSNQSAPVSHASSSRPRPPDVGFVDMYAPSVPSSSFAYRTWASTRHHEPTSADRTDEVNKPMRSNHMNSVESQPSSYYAMAASEMPSSLIHSADNIPIETVHAANEHAIHQRGASLMRSSRSDETMAASAFLANRESSTAEKKQFSHERAKDDIVIACRFSTPCRLATGARLAEQQLSEEIPSEPEGRPSNEGGMSTQTVSSVGGSDVEAGLYKTSVKSNGKPLEDGESDASNDIHAFEALRETIYAEVATLISQNETRPHYLIKLFRELQHLDSDYLRQRVLYAIQDLVLKRLTEDNIAGRMAVADQQESPLASAPEDLTPSESILSTEEGSKEENADGNSRGAESVNSERFDYAENVDTSSSLSTPTSTDTHSDQPFAGDSLGDTVIHVEKHPGIDTHQLDVQIKDIMKEIMPVLKEHMDEICSQHLLQYIRRLIMLLMKQNDDQHEMARFFHGQLGTLLQDALAKFEGRRLRDCGEDLLVDMSEILFNELAFFRLMQGLDNPKAKVKASLQQWQQNTASSRECDTAAPRDDEDGEDYKTASAGDPADAVRSLDKAEDEEHSSSSDESPERNGVMEDEGAHQMAGHQGSGNGYNMAFHIKQDQDSGETSYFSAMKIELAPSETKPYTRIGSDEDDEGDDEAANNEEPSDTAVSRDAQNGIMDDSGSEVDQEESQEPKQISTNSGTIHKPEPLQDDQPTHEADTADDAPGAAVASAAAKPASREQENEKDIDDTEKQTTSETERRTSESELTIDDLPTKLTSLSEQELADKMAAEQETNQIPEAVVSATPPGGTPLAGDPEAVNGPT